MTEKLFTGTLNHNKKKKKKKKEKKEMPFFILQVKFHTSNDFCDWRLLKDL